jgi:hypothetical protein
LNFLFGRSRLTQDEQDRTEHLSQQARTQHVEAMRMSRKIKKVEARNHFGERIRAALELPKEKDA